MICFDQWGDGVPGESGGWEMGHETFPGGLKRVTVVTAWSALDFLDILSHNYYNLLLIVANI